MSKCPNTFDQDCSYLGKIYDPLGIASPTVAEGKRIFEFRWTKQLRNRTVPQSIAKNLRKIKSIHLHIFAAACNLACPCVTIALIDQASGTFKGLPPSRSRISRETPEYRDLSWSVDIWRRTWLKIYPYH